MTRGWAALTAAAVLGLSSGRQASAVEGTYEAATTRVAVKLTERLSSQELKAGDAFRFDTTASALIDGIFLPARTHGHGVVVAARAGRGPQPGLLKLAVRSFDLPSGDAIPIALEPGQLDEVLEGAAPARPGMPRKTNVVYEKGTPFVVVAPPPPSPAPSTGS